MSNVFLEELFKRKGVEEVCREAEVSGLPELLELVAKGKLWRENDQKKEASKCTLDLVD